MVSKKEKLQNNLWYVREQLVRYLNAQYGIKTQFKFYANKELKKRGEFSSTTFPDRKKDKWGVIEVDICYDILISGQKKKLLDIAFKEAVRIGMWFSELPYENGHPEFEEELERKGLTHYNGTAETGLELHQYGCSQCKKLYVLKRKKLTTSKCPEAKELKSMCCRAPIKYFGTKFYKTEVLQKIKLQIDIESED